MRGRQGATADGFKPGESGHETDLPQRLFVPLERYGWEYAEPAPIVPSPLLHEKPAWREPSPPDWQAHDRKRRQGFWSFSWWAVGTLVVGVVVASTPVGPWMAPLVAVTGLAIGIGAVAFPERSFAQDRGKYTEHREALLARYETEDAAWRAEVAQHDLAEHERVTSAARWYPLRLREGWSRADVFGGTPDGWASLLATLGPSILESGNDVLVVDFSENGVAEDLARFAQLRGVPVSDVRLPAESSRMDVLAGLAAEAVAELIANAVHPHTDKNEQEARAFDADLLVAVAERLEKPYTFARLEAGVRVFRRAYDVGTEDVLTADEMRALNSHADAVSGTEKSRERLQILNGQLKRLVGDHDDAADPGSDSSVTENRDDRAAPDLADGRLWHRGGLTVVTTRSVYERRKVLYDRIVFHRVLRDLRAQHRGHGDAVIVVAGVDQLGLENLEAMSHQAKRVGVRLVLLMEHLRDELQQLLGGSDSASIVMRLGNHTEAAAAADFIGKGYKFVLSQITEQIGKTFTTGTSRSGGTSETTSNTESTSDGESTSRKRAPFWDDVLRDNEKTETTSLGTSRSESRSRAATWQETVNDSTADSTTAGRTGQRVYEYMVEPTTIQSLPPTVCFLVEPGTAENRRVTVGDCNPGITLLDHVSVEPRPVSEEPEP